jgi:3-phosphoshikimate 1-carboxyvinyltransferase
MRAPTADQQSLQILPVEGPLRGTVRVPGSKSLTNRALILAALAPGRTRLTNALFSDDSGYLAGALQELGFEVRLDPARAEMTITGRGGEIPATRAALFIGNAGTAARFLTAFLTLGAGEFIIDGDERMRQRPIGALAAALEELGANIRTVNPGDGPPASPPLKVLASGLRGGRARVAGETSSQFLSALLMVAPYARGPVELAVAGELNSKPYVDMTISVMDDFGVSVQRDGYECFKIEPAMYRSPESYVIESDASSASYFFAAAALLGGSVRVEGLNRRSRQGDLAFLEVLERMGCTIVEHAGGIEVARSGDLIGVDADMRDIPDTAQTLAAIAPFASGPTRIRGIASARLKESDRIAATCAELARLGVEVEEHPDGMTIRPCASIRPGTVRTYNDHRMAMAFALVGLRVPGIQIENPGCVAKTFPEYFKVLEGLR